MHLDRYVDDIARQMAVAAAAGGPEAESLAERLVLPLRSAVRLALLDSLSAAADELTLELAPGSVEVRLRGGEPSFVIEGVAATPPASVHDSAPPQATVEDAIAAEIDAAMRTFTAQDVQSTAIAEEGGSSRINLRMPDSLKARVEAAALREGRSVNAWLVRAAAAALQPSAPNPPNAPSPPAVSRRGSRHVTGWAQ
jgi:predicted HicB family RNase H-like nuclease